MFAPDVMAEIRADAVARWPEEACGVLAGGRYRPCRNIADDPRRGFRIAQAEISAARQAGPIEAIAHSHPDGWACPSALDMARQKQWDVPFIITVAHESGAEPPLVFGRQVPKAPLTGRGFVHGVRDCKALIDDWFRAHRGVELLDLPRDWEWWRTGGDLYREHFAAAGFRDIAEGELRPGDCVLFAIRSAVPNHAAVFLDGERIVHHPAGRAPVDPAMLSRIDPYTRWRGHAVRWARYHA
ncbi:C40 family peptidase [Minwuia thermotolerans]|uniref:NlpC/P60 domain-containing protein n=1 Tax=Minwuia thermotolerans TaxID=2056226 RepID=A0A2M9G2L9_9PROT|nr:C40 family peptidase [Minwuia thermotolerans]PJK29967.1 hypothetical protein CVT23_09375 [Minwuia thermotolerans]